jgi:hypothetical protein
MPFVRTRTTQAGSLSTSLAETYRDGNGKRRYRILANLHGEPDTLSALAKLATRREALRKEQQSMKKKRCTPTNSMRSSQRTLWRASYTPTRNGAKSTG